MLRISIINGPNLNLLGLREPSIYGTVGFEGFFTAIQDRFKEVDLRYFQSNVEGELINELHKCIGNVDAVIINPGAYTHTSIAIADAVAAIGLPVIEVHISNVFAREDYRKQSYISAKCVGSITGLGLDGYALAIAYCLQKLTTETS